MWCWSFIEEANPKNLYQAASVHAATPGSDGSTAPPPDAASAFDAASADAAPIVACASTASISAIMKQYGSGSTASTVTPMGARFESAAQALPISAANLSFLATASSNPSPSDATSASGLSWQSVTVGLYPSGTPSLPVPVSGSATNSPDSRGYVAEVNYLPWLNTKLQMQYVSYEKFNGGKQNYDGSGRNASDNNTLYLLGWLLF